MLANDAAISPEGAKLGDPRIAFLDYTEKLNKPYREIHEAIPAITRIAF